MNTSSHSSAPSEAAASDPGQTPGSGADSVDGSGAKLLHTSAKLRSRFSRHLAYGGRSGGNEFFESPEHASLADGLVIHTIDGTTLDPTLPLPTPMSNGVNLTYGQIMALAGDFYGLPNSPISDGADLEDQIDRFMAAFNTLDQADPNEVMNILGIMNDQATQVASIAQQNAGAPDAWSIAYTEANADDAYDRRYNQATGGSGSGPGWYLTKGRYLNLAATNWDHFGKHAITSFQAGHQAAIRQALVAKSSGLAADLMLAYKLEAFAGHFLSDLFSSGHLRTPRKEMHEAKTGDLCSRLMHDEDCYNGLVVQNALNESWTCYGDKRLNDTANATNMAKAQEALQASLTAIWECFQMGTYDNSYVGLQHAPTMDSVSNNSYRGNWSPLFIVDAAGDVAVRSEWPDLECYAWDTNFTYANSYRQIPNGGVHSLTASPPGSATWAHPYQWSSAAQLQRNGSAILNSGSPSAVLMPNPSYDPSAGDDDSQILHIVFQGQGSGHNLHHISLPVGTTPDFSANFTDEVITANGKQLSSPIIEPSAVVWNNKLVVVFGTQNSIPWMVTRNDDGTWGALTKAFSEQDAPNYGVAAGTRVGLQVVDGILYMAWCDWNGNHGTRERMLFSAFDESAGHFSTPVELSYTASPGDQQPTWGHTNQSISLNEYQGQLWMVFRYFSSYPILLSYTPPAAGQPPTSGQWIQRGMVASASGLWTYVGPALVLAQYAQEIGVVFADTSLSATAGNLWSSRPGSTLSIWRNVAVEWQGADCATDFNVSVVFPQGAPWLFYVDHKTKALSVLVA